MAITSWPDDTSHKSAVSCVICHKSIAPSHATAGLCDNNGNQAFACNIHFWNSAQLILGWSRFAARERQEACERKLTPIYMQRESPQP
jgi:hypothetical protein